MAENLTAVPQKFTAGETVEWTITNANYPAPTWVMTTTFINAAHKFAVTGTASGSDHLNTLAKTPSAALTAGSYQWQATVTNTTEVHLVGSGSVVVVAGFAAATTLDARSDAKIILDAIVAVLKGRASEDQLAMSIAGRSITKMALAELYAAKDRAERDYAKELKAGAILAGRQPRGRILTRTRV